MSICLISHVEFVLFILYKESGEIIILLISPIIGALIEAHIKLSCLIFIDMPKVTFSLSDLIFILPFIYSQLELILREFTLSIISETFIVSNFLITIFFTPQDEIKNRAKRI